MHKFFKQISEILGAERIPVSQTEKLVSGIGGFLSILGILVISQWAVGPEASPAIVASMGASAVLVFAVPHGPLSQPWPVFGGHIVSALVGVTSAHFISDTTLAASLAVGGAIVAMYYLRCIHPPGGATALSAIVAGADVQQLGYLFLITPVMLNTITILLIGVLFNSFFSWRLYPASLYRRKLTKAPSTPEAAPPHIAHEEFVYALSEIDSFIDINEHDLLRIYALATGKIEESSLSPAEITIGSYFSNGKYGRDWSVRQIVDASDSNADGTEIIIYKVVAGHGRRTSGYASREEFARWAKHRVIRDEENWKRVK
jgi:CBS-domain-containing membrane protein